MKPTRRDLEIIIEEAAGAWRPSSPDGAIRSSPAWHDLGADARREVFEVTQQLRTLEAALDPLGQSSTARRVLARIRGTAG